MSKTTKVPKIKPLEGYSGMSDADIVQRGTAIQTGLTGNSNFPNSPADLATLKTNIESLSALMAEAQDGSKKVIAQKNRQRETVIKMLRLLGRYVEVTSNGDMTIFTSSGFLAATTAKAPPAPCPCRSSKASIMAPSPEKSWFRFSLFPRRRATKSGMALWLTALRRAHGRARRFQG